MLFRNSTLALLFLSVATLPPSDNSTKPSGHLHNHLAYMTCIITGRIEILNLRTWQLEPPIQLTPGVDGMAWSPL